MMPDVTPDLREPAGDEFEGESYLASLSDLMVGMLFVFILMLMAFALTYRTAQDASEQSNQQLQSELNVLGKAQSLLTENDQIRRNMLRSLKEELARRGVQVIIDEQSGVLRLPDDLLFDSGEAKLRRGGIEPLRTLASIMASVLPCYSRPEISATILCPADTRPVLEAVYVEGHTDNRPIRGVYENNWALSTARAVKTYGTLIETQPSLLNLRNLEDRSLLGVSGYGEARPVASNDSSDGQAQNRRIDLRFILAAPSAEDLERIKEQTGRRLEKDRSQ